MFSDEMHYDEVYLQLNRGIGKARASISVLFFVYIA